MQLRKHPSATCRRCESPLWYGLKREGRGWKIHCECDRKGCGRTWTAGYVPLGAVGDRDEAFERAQRRCAETR